MARVQTALVSVSDKRGIVEFGSLLVELGVNILSTGGTARLLKDNGLSATEVSEYTGFPEILDGRLKTLHPKVHGGLLALRENENHRREIEKYGIMPIDMVVVNLYPFEQTIARPNVELAEAIENIDIGGPTMIRAASKNYTHVAVVVNPDRYEQIGELLSENDCELPDQLHYELAVEAFEHTARYDHAIANYLSRLQGKVMLPKVLCLDFQKKQSLRYGENPHQAAAFYVERNVKEPSISSAEQISGKELSFNNILDADAAIELVKEFAEPGAVCIKHTNPCGAAVASSLRQAYQMAYDGDPVSAFGCIIGLNRKLDVATAQEIVTRRSEEAGGFFAEAIAAPDFDPEAVKVITEGPSWGANVRLLKTGTLSASAIQEDSLDLRRVNCGLLAQARDMIGIEMDSLKVVTKRQPGGEELEDLTFAWLVCKHVKSNAIVLSNGRMVVGCGAGQMSRLDSVIIAARKAGDRSKNSVLASDAFFPMRDALDAAAEAGVKAVIQPGGSKKDDEIIAAADEHGIAMVFTGARHFRH